MISNKDGDSKQAVQVELFFQAKVAEKIKSTSLAKADGGKTAVRRPAPAEPALNRSVLLATKNTGTSLESVDNPELLPSRRYANSYPVHHTAKTKEVCNESQGQ